MDWKCKYCEQEFNFTLTSEKANHSRWCDKNPKRNNTENISKALQSRHNRLLGKVKDFSVTCTCCSKSFIVKEREKSFPSKKEYFCSRSCANKRIHTEEIKRKIANSLLTQKKEKRHCKYCNVQFEVLEKSTKRFCSIKCGSIYRYKDVDKNTLRYYRQQCAFDFSLNDFPEEFDFALIEKYGWYKAKNRGDNLGGVSRDHMVSVKYGWENNIDPKIISHPANCKLMVHGDNVRKHSNCDMTIDELNYKIKRWNLKYGA